MPMTEAISRSEALTAIFSSKMRQASFTHGRNTISIISLSVNFISCIQLNRNVCISVWVSAKQWFYHQVGICLLVQMVQPIEGIHTVFVLMENENIPLPELRIACHKIRKKAN